MIKSLDTDNWEVKNCVPELDLKNNKMNCKCTSLNPTTVAN